MIEQRSGTSDDTPIVVDGKPEEDGDEALYLERDGDGEVSICGASPIKIPNDKLAVNLFSVNPIIPGTIFADDGLVKDRERNPILTCCRVPRKWYDSFSSDYIGKMVRYWPPILKDVVALEARRWKMLLERQKILDGRYNDAHNAVIEAGQAHVKVTHKFTGDSPPWWLYRKTGDGDREGITWDWVDTPVEPINLEIGTEYHHATKRFREIGARSGLFNEVFDLALTIKLGEIKSPKTTNQQLSLTINGRIYWFFSTYSKLGNLMWKKLSYPEGDVVYVNLGETDNGRS